MDLVLITVLIATALVLGMFLGICVVAYMLGATIEGILYGGGKK